MESRQKSTEDFNRREILKYGLYGGLATSLPGSLWLSGCGDKKGHEKRPHVVLVVLDTARADRFSCLGYARQTSTHIDRLASEGVVFEHAYTTCCWTLPAHASLFTGLYPLQAGATSETLQLPPNNPTLAEMLKEAEYNTAAFICNPWVARERGFARGFNEFHEMWREEKQAQVPAQTGQTEWAALREVLDWLEEVNPTENPFFCFINFNCTHLPYRPPEPFLSKFITPGFMNEEVNRVAVVKSMWPHLAGELILSERDYHIMSDLYDGEVAFADHCVGQIIEKLRTLSLLDETVVIVTSDHGENLGEHGLIDHNLNLYETVLRIPLVIRYPKTFAGGARISDLISIMDIAPTILDLCNVDNGIKKINSTETSLTRNDRTPRAIVVAGNERPLSGIALMKERYPDFDTSSIDYRRRALRIDPYKLICKVGGDNELYNLKSDPGERRNLADKQPDINAKLQKTLNKWMAQIPAGGDVSFLKSQDQETREILRSLGYIK